MSREKQIELLEKQLAFWEHHSTQLAEELDKEEKIANHYAMLDKTEELNAERVEREWISVDERLPDRELEELRRQTKNPDKYYHCIVYICYETFGFVTDAWYGNDKFVGNHDYCPISNITHWMPLPEAPKMKGGAE